MGKHLRAALLALVGVLLILGGCADTFSEGLNSRLLSGALVETKGSDGQVQRLSVNSLEPWDRWQHNPIKGDGDSCILKAEATF